MIPLEERAYAAGFFDGEGSVSILHLGRKGNLEVCVGISQKNLIPLLWLQKRWGGYIRLNKATEVSELRLSGWRAMCFLREVRPYIQVKELAIAIVERFQQRKGICGVGRGHILPSEEVEERLALKKALQEVNKNNGLSE